MNEPDIRDSRVWQPAGYPVRIVIRPRAEEQMRRETSRRAAGSRGGDAGGLLVGYTERSGIQTVTVEEVEPVAWTYMMAPADRRELEAALRVRQNSGRRAVVGYFRTHWREGLSLNAGDLALIRALFPDPTNVFLLLKPGPEDTLESRLFFWQNGIMRSEVGSNETPFGRPAVTNEEPTPAAQAMAERAREAPPRLRRPLPLPPPPPRLEDEERVGGVRPWAKPTLWTVAGATALTAALLFVPPRWFVPGPPAAASTPAPPEQSIGLEVEKRATDLIVRWDRTAPAVTEATRAVLRIEDGLFQRISELDSDQLQTGSLYYTPAGGDLEFRMEVYGATGEPVVESLRVLSASVSGLVLPAERLTPPAVPRTGSDFERSRTAGPAASGGSTGTQQDDVQAMLAHARSLGSRYKPKAAEPPPVAVEAPPRLAARTMDADVGPAIPVATTIAPAPPPQPVPSPPSQPAAAPVRATGAHYVGPRPITQVRPMVSNALRNNLRDNVEIGVRVEIDASGKVTRSNIVTRKGPLNAFLSDNALSAASQWRFQPATVGGKPVASTMVLNFRFVR